VISRNSYKSRRLDQTIAVLLEELAPADTTPRHEFLDTYVRLLMAEQ
jgi:hypothetical protein